MCVCVCVGGSRYQLRCYLYQCRDLLAMDKDSFSGENTTLTTLIHTRRPLLDKTDIEYLYLYIFVFCPFFLFSFVFYHVFISFVILFVFLCLSLSLSLCPHILSLSV